MTPTVQAFMNDPCVNFVFFFSRQFLHRFSFNLFDDFISILAGVLLLLQVLMKPLWQLWQVRWSFVSVAWQALASIFRLLAKIWEALKVKFLLLKIWKLFESVWHLLCFLFKLPFDMLLKWVAKIAAYKKIILEILLVAAAIALLYLFVW